MREEDSWDLFSNGNYVGSYGSMDDVRKAIAEEARYERSCRWEGTPEEIELAVSKAMDARAYHVVRSTRLRFGRA